jgi:L-amino acid N-acyltransferase YncA
VTAAAAVHVRDARPDDGPACAAVYAPFVTGTATTFETDPPEPAAMAERIAAASREHAWLVAEQAGRVVGYAYATAWKGRPAYRWSCEVSVYVEPGRHGGGVGRALYTALLDRLTERGFRMAVAGMTLPNEPSARLHRAFGFRSVGVLHGIGWKNGAWHDVELLQRPLGPPADDGPPAEPR